MSTLYIEDLIERHIAGDITDEEHQHLQQILKSDATARALFREAMDLDTSLRTWAAENPCILEKASSSVEEGDKGIFRYRRTQLFSGMAVAVSLAFLLASFWYWHLAQGNPAPSPVNTIENNGSSTASFGTLIFQNVSIFEKPKAPQSGSRFSTGAIEIAEGIAELKFDTGTNLVLTAPCSLEIISDNTAKLLAGEVVVNVTELSDGFNLLTPDALIIDEGTEYAVFIDDEATEVHVLDGSVLWEPIADDTEDSVERIEAGEARRYIRSKPSKGSYIPLDKKMFGRRVRAKGSNDVTDVLFLYDGFDNFPGLQRDLNEIGWTGDWLFPDQGSGKLPLVSAPAGRVFGFDRTGRSQIRLINGMKMQRSFEMPLRLRPGSIFYLSFILQRKVIDKSKENYLQLTLGSNDVGRRNRSKPEIGFGISSDGFPFIKSCGTISQTAQPLESDVPYLCVGKIIVSSHMRIDTYMRIYKEGEQADDIEPNAWTVKGNARSGAFDLELVKLSSGSGAWYDLDELKIGPSWQTVTADYIKAGWKNSPVTPLIEH